MLEKCKQRTCHGLAIALSIRLEKHNTYFSKTLYYLSVKDISLVKVNYYQKPKDDLFAWIVANMTLQARAKVTNSLQWHIIQVWVPSLVWKGTPKVRCLVSKIKVLFTEDWNLNVDMPTKRSALRFIGDWMRLHSVPRNRTFARAFLENLHKTLQRHHAIHSAFDLPGISHKSHS